MSYYTYTIYDSHPAASGPCHWPDHENVEIEADDDAEALADVRTILEVAACGLSADGYEVGQRLYASVWDADENDLGLVTIILTAEDLL
jgi:hypothetical protein